MKTLVCKIIFVLLVLFILNVRAESQIEFRLVQKFMIVVSVTINDVERFDFLLDTGTNSTAVTPEVAQKLKLRPRDRIELITVAGKQIVPRAFLQTVALGSFAAQETEVLITDLPAIQAIDKNIRGVLGQNFLSQFNYLLDFEKRRIVFDADGELENRLRGKQISIETRESQLFVIASVKQKKLRLALDSGASNIILFGGITRQLEFAQNQFSLAEVSTNTGNGAAKTTRLDFLRIGDETFYDLPAILVADKDENRAEDGLLPLRLFRAVYFNHQKGFVILNPKLSK